MNQLPCVGVVGTWYLRLVIRHSYTISRNIDVFGCIKSNGTVNHELGTVCMIAIAIN